MAQKDFAAQNERVPDRAAPPRRERRHVLVVDDNRDCADSLQLVLSSLGHEVQVAYDGFQAMNEVLQESRAFDVVLLDLSMPGMDGFDLARRLRKAAPCCPSIVAVSGWADLPTKQKAREAGIDGYLVKPVEVEELRVMLDEAGSATIPAS